MNNSVKKIIGLLFAMVCLFFAFNNTITVKATEDDVIENLKNVDDGITNWTYTKGSMNPSNKIGKIPIGSTNYLDYTFGSARNLSGKVATGDTTITKDSTLDSGGRIYNSKINVFLENNNNYYSILHQPSDAYVGGPYPGHASDTSLDFAYVKTGDVRPTSSILNQMKFKVFYTGTDVNNKPVFKIGGFLPNDGLYAEILLRPSLTGSAIVQRELYLYSPKNNNHSITKVQVYFGEDTSLGFNNVEAIDDVPLYAIGNDNGLYLYNNQNPSSATSKLYVTNQVADGFTTFMGKAFSSTNDKWNLKGKSNTGGPVPGGDIVNPNITYNKGTGDNGRAAGSNLLWGTDSNGNLFPVVDDQLKQNTAYTLRWDVLDNIDPGKTYHFASTIGATVSPYALPQVSKSYTNPTPHADGLNHVGDKLHFTLTIQNLGPGSRWNYGHVTDAMPAGLTIDPNSIKFKTTSLKPQGSGNDLHDVETTTGSGTINAANATGNALNFAPEFSLYEKDKYYITFDATVNLDVSKSPTPGYITNSALFTGNNMYVGTGIDRFTDSVKIPVKVPDFKPTFTKQLRNISSNKDAPFENTAEGKKDDIIEYRATLNNAGTATMKSATFSDTLPKDIEFIPGTIKINNVAQSDSLSLDNISLTANPTNAPVTIDFQAKVTGVDNETVSNIATLNKVVTSTGETYNNLISNSADLNITATKPTMSFIDYPTSIDFGTINSDGTAKMLPNISTNGRLVVSHSADSPFQVTVSYDNNGKDAINSNGTKLVQNADNVLYLDQDDNSSEENWTPITSEGIPIKTSGFSGSTNNLDLTNYIGVNKWKLRIPSNTTAGYYSGRVTWGISDSV